MRAFVLGAVAALSMAAATPASAALVFVTYGGTASGVDNLGYFGDVGGVFTDAAFTSSFVFDTDQGVRVTNGFSDTLSGPGALVSASFSLNGVTFDLAPGTSGQHQAYYAGNGVHSDAQGLTGVGMVFYRQSLNFNALVDPVPWTIEQFAHFEGNLDNVNTPSDVTFTEETILDPITLAHSDVISDFDISLTSLDITVNGAIPEPGTWALMILGFGAAGSALRRRRALTA